MADTQPLAPTDAELMDLGHECELDAIAFGRAVLAKWGAQPVPASAAEFALQVLVAAGHVTQERVDQAIALPGAPAQPKAAPLPSWRTPSTCEHPCAPPRPAIRF